MLGILGEFNNIKYFFLFVLDIFSQKKCGNSYKIICL